LGESERTSNKANRQRHQTVEEKMTASNTTWRDPRNNNKKGINLYRKSKEIVTVGKSETPCSENILVTLRLKQRKYCKNGNFRGPPSCLFLKRKRKK